MGDVRTHRQRGRPLGGGVAAEELREAFLDAAERSFSSLGYRASTMEVIARTAGYSRGNIYRHFETRERLLEALVQRTTQRHMTGILQRLPGADSLTLVVEALVIVATELAEDPLLRTVSEQSEEGTVAHMIANDGELTRMVEVVMQQMLGDRDGAQIRRGLNPKDIAQYIISTAISMLSGNIPGIKDPAVARRYIDVFVLPTLIADPPAPARVFPDAE